MRPALERLSSVVYGELRRIARRFMRNERAGITLQATALVNGVYVRMVDVSNVDWKHRCHSLLRCLLPDALCRDSLAAAALLFTHPYRNSPSSEESQPWVRCP
jgi:hypothetical protein